MAAVAIALLTWWSAGRSPGSEHDLASSTKDPMDKGGAAQPADPAPSALNGPSPIGRIPAVLADEGSYLILNEQGQPLANASMSAASADSRFLTGRALAIADANGTLRLPSGFHLPPGGYLAVWATGHLPASVGNTNGGTIVLRRGNVLHGKSVDRSGKPVKGMRIALSRASMQVRALTQIPDDTKPAPRPDAVHMAVSDSDGNFMVDGLDHGTYRLDCLHELMFVFDAGIGDADTIAIPRAPLTVRLDTVYAARLRVEGSSITTVNFRFPGWRCGSPIGLRSAEALLSSRGLRNGWEGTTASYFVPPGLDIDRGTCTARVALFFPDSPMQVLDVPLRPITDDYTHTVQATAAPGLSSVVTLVARDARGRHLQGLPIHLMRFHPHEEDAISESHSIASGASAHILKGDFQISTSHPILTRLLSRSTVSVEQDQQAVDIQFSGNLQPVHIMCADFTAGDCLVKIESAMGQRTSQYVRDGKPVTLWLPSGTYKLVITRFGCRNGTTNFTVPTEDIDGGLRITIPDLEKS